MTKYYYKCLKCDITFTKKGLREHKQKEHSY